MYSQMDEEKIIQDFFGDTTGRFLDIGAYDGKTFSNTKALSDRGWTGVLVEPSPMCFQGCMTNTPDDGKVQLVNALIGSGEGLKEFWNTPDAVSSSDRKHVEMWTGYIKDYRKIYLPVLSPKWLLQAFPGPYDFISIDTEGSDFEILRELDLEALKTRLVCIEFGRDLEPIYEHLFNRGFKEISHNPQNIICAKL